MSLTSSCEIVDALEDAANDVTAGVESKEPSPAVELSWVAGAESSMTSSQYAQVVFNDIKDSYPIDLDLEVSYTLTSFIQPGHGDRICLYKLPYLQPHEYVAYVWTKMNTNTSFTVRFPVSALPREEDFYQFQYLKSDNQVAGASVPFQLRQPGSTTQEVTGVTEEDDLMVVQTPATSLQEKYSSLLDLSEKLTHDRNQLVEELNKKNESFIVLERTNQSLVESSEKYRDLETDLETLVRDKLELEKTLTQTTETLASTERVLKTTSDQLESVEKMLEEKKTVIDELKSSLESYEVKVGGYSSDVQLLTQERDSLAAMLDQEIKARENLMNEKMELMERLEDTTNMLNAATNSKDMAVAEIRSQIEQQDKLRQELARVKEDAGHVEAELVIVKQQLSKITENEGDSYVVTTVLSSLGEKLEARERELKQKNEEITLLRELENSKNTIEIHEKCLEDADTRATDLEKRNKELEEENDQLKMTMKNLESSNQELTARLEAGAFHYKKLAAEKKLLEKTDTAADNYVDKIDSLEKTIEKLTEELRQAHLAQDLKLSEIQSAVNNSSNNSMVERVERLSEVSLDTCSETSNMDSVRIEQAVKSSLQHKPVVRMPGLFNPILHRPQPPFVESQASASAPLPTPLLPDNCHPSTIPELVPRRPAPYSTCSNNNSSNNSTPERSSAGASVMSSLVQHSLLKCPLCADTFDQEKVEDLQRHVNKHIDDNYKNCPMCNEKFDKDVPQKDFEEHVQQHFKDQQQVC